MGYIINNYYCFHSVAHIIILSNFLNFFRLNLLKFNRHNSSIFSSFCYCQLFISFHFLIRIFYPIVCQYNHQYKILLCVVFFQIQALHRYLFLLLFIYIPIMEFHKFAKAYNCNFKLVS